VNFTRKAKMGSNQFAKLAKNAAVMDGRCIIKITKISIVENIKTIIRSAERTIGKLRSKKPESAKNISLIYWVENALFVAIINALPRLNSIIQQSFENPIIVVEGKKIHLAKNLIFQKLFLFVVTVIGKFIIMSEIWRQKHGNKH
jgi:ABC-type maltose transport system permease subunit